jgi:hypothetical protein
MYRKTHIGRSNGEISSYWGLRAGKRPKCVKHVGRFLGRALKAVAEAWTTETRAGCERPLDRCGETVEIVAFSTPS